MVSASARHFKRCSSGSRALALARWQARTANFTLITQNVDGLLQRAGSRDVVELHGNIRLNRCFTCGAETVEAVAEFRGGELPLCGCGGLLRPGVVWFGEMLPERELQVAFAATEHCDLFLTVGTSAQVYPAAALPQCALAHGATVLEINLEVTPFSSSASYHLRGAAGEVLTTLVDSLQNS